MLSISVSRELSSLSNLVTISAMTETTGLSKALEYISNRCLVDVNVKVFAAA